MLKKIFLSLSVLILLIFVVAFLRHSFQETAATNVSVQSIEKGHVFSVDGSTYSLVDGCEAYQLDNGTWNFVDHLCPDPAYKNRYSHRDGRWYIRVDDGRETALPGRFVADFESARSLKDLFIDNIGQVGWTAMTLQSPKAPTVGEYVALREGLLAGTCDFLDNRVELSHDRVHTGSQSLRFFSSAPSSDMVTAKSSIETQLLRFTKGDDVWYSAWYYLEKGVPTTLMDLESAWLKEYPGPRLWLNEDRSLEVELKALDKPRYKQTGTPLTVPLKRWTHIVLHYKLSDTAEGVTEVWQDERKIIEAHGKNIPFPDTILNSLEIGITSNSHPEDALLYMDDISLAKDAPLGY